MELKEHNWFNDVVKRKIGELKNDIAKLKAVDNLIGETATEQKKEELINTIFVLQDVQCEILDKMEREQSMETTRRLMQKD